MTFFIRHPSSLIHLSFIQRPGKKGFVRYYKRSATARTAGTLLLHAGEHEALMLHKIDDCGSEHLIGPVLQKHPEAVLFEGHIARLGGFGYVHSQRGASAAGDQENPHTVARLTLLSNHFFKLNYRSICQTQHTATSSLLVLNSLHYKTVVCILHLQSTIRNCFFIYRFNSPWG